jgi:hypothetical protein
LIAKANQQRYRNYVIERMALLGYDDVADHIVSETCYVAETGETIRYSKAQHSI